jgi:hypothetical protein
VAISTPPRTSTAAATRTVEPTRTAVSTRTVEPTGTAEPTRTPGGGACAKSQGYWRTHVAEWPVTMLELGDITYGQAELIWLIRVPTRGDASVILARQLIAAKLNVANGADDSVIGYFIDKADEVLARHGDRLPFFSRPWNNGWAVMLGLAAVLDDYNNSGDGC